MSSPLVTFSALSGLRSDSVDTTNAVIRGVSVLTSGLVARGHDLAVDAVTLSQMLTAAEGKGKVPVKVNHKSGAEAVCGYLDNFRITGAKLKADWHLLKTHPQKDQILEVANVMPTGVGLSASFLPPEKAEAGKAWCEELLSVDYVTLPAANPDGLFSARVDDSAAARRKATAARVAKIAGAGALGAVGAAGIASRGLDAVAGIGVRRLVPSPKVRAGLIGAAAAVGATHTVRAVTKKRPLPPYAEDARRDMAADFTAALVSFGMTRAEAAQSSARLVRAEEEAARPAFIPPRRSLGKRVGLRLVKVGVGAAGGAYIGRKLGTAAGAATGAAAGLLFQSKNSPVRIRRRLVRFLPGGVKAALGAGSLAYLGERARVGIEERKRTRPAAFSCLRLT